MGCELVCVVRGKVRRKCTSVAEDRRRWKSARGKGAGLERERKERRKSVDDPRRGLIDVGFAVTVTKESRSPAAAVPNAALSADPAGAAVRATCHCPSKAPPPLF